MALQRFGEGEEIWLWVYDRLGQADLSPLILPDRPNEFLFSKMQKPCVLASWREVLLLRLGVKSLLRFVESFLPMERFVSDGVFDPLDPLV